MRCRLSRARSTICSSPGSAELDSRAGKVNGCEAGSSFPSGSGGLFKSWRVAAAARPDYPEGSPRARAIASFIDLAAVTPLSDDSSLTRVTPASRTRWTTRSTARAPIDPEVPPHPPRRSSAPLDREVRRCRRSRNVSSEGSALRPDRVRDGAQFRPAASARQRRPSDRRRLVIATIGTPAASRVETRPPQREMWARVFRPPARNRYSSNSSNHPPARFFPSHTGATGYSRHPTSTAMVIA